MNIAVISFDDVCVDEGVTQLLEKYGKEVNVIKKVNRWKYLIEYTPGGKTYYIDVDSLQII